MDKYVFLVFLSSFMFAFPGTWALVGLLRKLFEQGIIPESIEFLLVPLFLFAIIWVIYFFTKNLDVVIFLIAIQILVGIIFTLVLSASFVPYSTFVPAECEAECASHIGRDLEECLRAEMPEWCRGECVLEPEVWAEYVCRYDAPPELPLDWFFSLFVIWAPFVTGLAIFFIGMPRREEKKQAFQKRQE